MPSRIRVYGVSLYWKRRGIPAKLLKALRGRFRVDPSSSIAVMRTAERGVKDPVQAVRIKGRTAGWGSLRRCHRGPANGRNRRIASNPPRSWPLPIGLPP